MPHPTISAKMRGSLRLFVWGLFVFLHHVTSTGALGVTIVCDVTFTWPIRETHWWVLAHLSGPDNKSSQNYIERMLSGAKRFWSVTIAVSWFEIQSNGASHKYRSLTYIYIIRSVVSPRAYISSIVFIRCHDFPKRTGTDLRKYRNGLLWVPKRTSMGTIKGRVGYDRNDPNKDMYVYFKQATKGEKSLDSEI